MLAISWPGSFPSTQLNKHVQAKSSSYAVSVSEPLGSKGLWLSCENQLLAGLSSESQRLLAPRIRKHTYIPDAQVRSLLLWNLNNASGLAFDTYGNPRLSGAVLFSSNQCRPTLQNFSFGCQAPPTLSFSGSLELFWWPEPIALHLWLFVISCHPCCLCPD